MCHPIARWDVHWTFYVQLAILSVDSMCSADVIRHPHSVTWWLTRRGSMWLSMAALASTRARGAVPCPHRAVRAAAIHRLFTRSTPRKLDLTIKFDTPIPTVHLAPRVVESATPGESHSSGRASTILRRRRLSSLQREAWLLERELRRLQSQNKHAHPWRRVAMRQRSERHRAERENEALKRELDAQMQIAQALHCALRK